MRVSQIRYQPIEGGTLGGHFALHVTLGVDASFGPESFNLTPSELSTSIHNAFSKLDFAFKTQNELVLFDCVAGEVNTEEMLSLLGTLRDWGMKIVVWIRDDKRCAWFELANYITVFLCGQHWANFKANEIRYTILNGEAEPDIYDVNQGAYLYVYNHTNVLSFIKNAPKHRWAVILESRKSVGIEFPIRIPEKE